MAGLRRLCGLKRPFDTPNWRVVVAPAYHAQMTHVQRWEISVVLLVASAASLISFGLVGIGRGNDFGFDFRVMHLGGLTWLEGRNPYDEKQLDQTYHDYINRPGELGPKSFFDPPFSYPPQSAALFLPCSLLSLSTATYAWWFLNSLALAGVIAMTLASLKLTPGGLSDPLRWSVPVAFMVGNPLTTNIFWQGQTTLICFAASMGGWFFGRRRDWMLAGLCLAVASIKPQLCLFIVLWLLLETRLENALRGRAGHCADERLSDLGPQFIGGRH